MKRGLKVQGFMLYLAENEVKRYKIMVNNNVENHLLGKKDTCDSDKFMLFKTHEFSMEFDDF